MSTITAAELAALLDANATVTVVDTRTPESYASWHVPGAVNVPYEPSQSLEDVSLPADLDRTDRVVTICGKGKSSGLFAEELAANGFRDVAVVAGGMRAWSSVYETVRVLARADVEVVQVQRRAKGCLGYVVADPRTDEAAVVDPSRHTDTYLDVAADAGYDVVRVLDTHVHADHVSGGRALADHLDVPYHLGTATGDRDVAFEYDALARNETVTVGDVPLKAVPTPGHTSDLTSYVVADAAVLTGDALFVDSVGRTELQFGDADAARGARLQYESLHRTLLALPDSVRVLPGHVAVGDDGTWSPVDPGQPVRASVGTLRERLDVLALDEPEFVERLTSNQPPKPPNYERVVAINRGHESVADDGEATELELGPNRCAAP